MGNSNGTVTTTATYNTVSMTSAGKIWSNNQTDGYVELFYLVAPATGSNTALVTCSHSRIMEGGSVSFTGADQSTPVSGAATNFGFDATPTINISGATGDMVVDAMCTGTHVTSSNQSSRWIANFDGTSGAGNGAQSTANGVASVTMSYAVTSDWWGIVGLNVKAATTLAGLQWIAGVNSP